MPPVQEVRYVPTFGVPLARWLHCTALLVSSRCRGCPPIFGAATAFSAFRRALGVRLAGAEHIALLRFSSVPDDSRAQYRWGSMRSLPAPSARFSLSRARRPSAGRRPSCTPPRAPERCHSCR
eukprot:UN2773